MKIKLILGLIFITYSNTSFAAYDADELQKLFTDKNQRTRIDAMRSGNAPTGETRPSNKINVNGYVTRSGGKSVVWINNENTFNSSTLGDINVKQSNTGKNKKVTINVNGRTKQLKPGETWYKDTDKVIDSQ